MKWSTSLLAALHISSHIVAAQPFVIFNTRVQDVLPTQAVVPRQNLIDTINSALSADFGGGDETSTTLAPAVTRAPPSAASTTASSKAPKHTTSSDSDDSQGSAATSSQDGSAATSSLSGTNSTSISSTSTSTSTPAPHSTTTPAPSATLATSSTPTPTPSTNSDDNNSTVPAGGVVVAVIMCLVIVAVTMFLVFRYNARCQAWWAAREERRRQERSYRDAIDGPGSNSLRQQALSGSTSRRRTMLASFFAPATARLSDNTEIRRKPVNWGAPAVPAVPQIPDAYSPTSPTGGIEDEKLSLTASAAPLGQIERYSMIPVATQLPAPPLPPKPLPTPKPEHHTSPTFLPIPTSGSFVAELPACVPAASPPQPQYMPEPQTQPITLTRNLTNKHGFGGPLPATRYEPNPGPKTPTAPTHPMTLPVSPISLHPNATSPNLGPVSPISTYTTRSVGYDHSRSISTMTTSTTTSNTNARRESIPMLPPLPAIPGLIHAKRGSDGVFRLT